MQVINQLISIIQSGQPIGGMFKGEDKSNAVMYYYRDGQYYVGSGANGGPASMDEVITEEELRRRLEGHFNSISEEEREEDIAYIGRMHANLVESARVVPAEDLTITVSQASLILHMLDEVHVYGDGLESDQEVLARYLYSQLPPHAKKDIEELELYIEVIEE